MPYVIIQVVGDSDEVEAITDDLAQTNVKFGVWASDEAEKIISLLPEQTFTKRRKNAHVEVFLEYCKSLDWQTLDGVIFKVETATGRGM